MDEESTRREFGRGCLGATVLGLLAGGAIIELATSKYLERQRFRNSFLEIENEILGQFKRYATRTPEQIRADASLKPEERYNSIWREENKIICSGSSDGGPVENGPHFTITSFAGDLPKIDFWYHRGKELTHFVGFSKSIEGYEFILSKNINSNAIVHTIRYVIDPQKKRLTKSLYRLCEEPEPKKKTELLKDCLNFEESEEILLLINNTRRNYLTERD